MSTCINGERRTPFPPSGTCPTRSQPYGSFKHIVLDVKAGDPGKVECTRSSIYGLCLGHQRAQKVKQPKAVCVVQAAKAAEVSQGSVKLQAKVRVRVRA
ncbi:hypothetical protein FOC4_g10000530 [Fusarium odoratissimum]|uniref:Uncharacterized protein n=2 Tax=Fusarium oxysporum species complex TaxID=171631 RepID=N1S3Q0_FUSC4|nr:hypothetical protein FOC4_g10000530 [Fusarium odoratissimum]